MTRANVLAGEVGIYGGGREYIFRPSFRALADLGSPVELVEIYKQVQRADHVGFAASLSVLYAMCNHEDPCKLLGYFREIKGRLKYVGGLISEPQDIPILACHLLVNGMIGLPSKKNGREAKEFNPAEFVGAAVAHLGVTTCDAWNMTMMEFQHAINAKYGEETVKKSEIPTAEELDELDRAVYGDDS